MTVQQWIMSKFGMDTDKVAADHKVAAIRVIQETQMYNDTVNSPYGSGTLIITETENAMRFSSSDVSFGLGRAMTDEHYERESSFVHARSMTGVHHNYSLRASEIQFSDKPQRRI